MLGRLGMASHGREGHAGCAATKLAAGLCCAAARLFACVPGKISEAELGCMLLLLKLPAVPQAWVWMQLLSVWRDAP